MKVIDSHALLAFLEKEKGYQRVEKLFAEAFKHDKMLYMSAVNYGEVYYIVLRECGNKIAEETEFTISQLPIEIIDVTREIAKIAGYFKAKYNISYADCFSLALARVKNTSVVTGDPEFKAAESEVRVDWLR